MWTYNKSNGMRIEVSEKGYRTNDADVNLLAYLS